MSAIFPLTLPFIPGQDFAGVVDAVGDGVSGFMPGQRVFGAVRIEKAGAYAQYIASPAPFVAALPDAVAFPEVAAVPVAGLTAWQALFEIADLQRGQTVLIHGGSGGVGHFAVQFAHHAGAHVIATASGANRDFVCSLGADTVIDYRSERFETVARGVDMVLDGVGGDTRARSWGVMRPGATLVSIVAAPGEVEQAATAYNCQGVGFHMTPKREQLAEIARLIATGAVTARIGAAFALRDARAAHERFESGASVQGKVVLLM